MKYFPYELDRSATNNSFISFKSAWKYFQWIRKGIFYQALRKYGKISAIVKGEYQTLSLGRFLDDNWLPFNASAGHY